MYIALLGLMVLAAVISFVTDHRLEAAIFCIPCAMILLCIELRTLSEWVAIRLIMIQTLMQRQIEGEESEGSDSSE